MPLYEYLCPECGVKFELKRPMSQASEAAPCPRCRQSAARILSTFACLSRDEGGQAAPIGGSSCASCSATSCETCGL